MTLRTNVINGIYRFMFLLKDLACNWLITLATSSVRVVSWYLKEMCSVDHIISSVQQKRLLIYLPIAYWHMSTEPLAIGFSNDNGGSDPIQLTNSMGHVGFFIRLGVPISSVSFCHMVDVAALPWRCTVVINLSHNFFLSTEIGWKIHITETQLRTDLVAKRIHFLSNVIFESFSVEWNPYPSRWSHEN